METSSNHWISLRHTELNDAEHDLDALLSLLYDDMNSKVEASHKISLMSLEIHRLGPMASHKSALGALARVLREEGRKSFQLRSNAVSTFWIFSHFQNFHQLLIENQIGRATLQLLELEYMRIQNLPNPGTGLKVRMDADQVLDLSTIKEDNMLSSNLMENKPALQEQERFLYMSICLLYHIAEDLQIEKRMQKYNLVQHLCEVLNRTNTYLLIIVVVFLKRLSLYIENLDAMRENSIVFKLSNILHSGDELLLCDTLRVLWNLSFDRRFREDTVDSGILHSLKALLQKKKFEQLVFGILYNLSRDFDLRLKISESDLLSILIESFLSEHDVNVPEELNALIINLTYIPKMAMLNLEATEVEKFVTFVLRTSDILLYKAVKNVSYLKAAKHALFPLVPALVTCLLRCETCIQVEIMEILFNLACSDEVRDRLLINTSLLNYITAHLQVSNNEDDINLQIIMLIGRVCSISSASTISQVGLVENLCALFLDRRDDVDIALQSLYAMYCFLGYDSTRYALLQQFEKVVHYIVELSQDCEKSVVAMADLVIDTILDMDNSRGHCIRSVRFNIYNAGWSELF